MDIKAIVFDMDGVLIDSEPVYQRIICNFLEVHGLNLPKEATDDLVGCANSYFEARLATWWDEAPIKRGDERKMSAAEALDLAFSQETIDYAALLNPGVACTLDALRDVGVRCAVASSTDAAGIAEALGEAGVLDKFDFTLSGNDFAQSKPHPEIYLTAIERLGLPADACIAVEDSPRGIAAARAAGLRVAVKREERFGFSQGGGTWYISAIPELLDIVGRSMN